MAFREAFDSEFAIDDGNDDTPITGRQRTIDDQHIPGMDAGLPHGLSGHPDEKGCCRMLNEVLIEIEGAIEIIIGRGRIAS